VHKIEYYVFLGLFGTSIYAGSGPGQPERRASATPIIIMRL
jgi:hypothetical protein